MEKYIDNIRHDFGNKKLKIRSMSRGFVKEYEDQWLNEIAPTMSALIRFLTIESNGVPVHEKRNYLDQTTDRVVHEMSNGLSYSLGEDGKWYILD